MSNDQKQRNDEAVPLPVSKYIFTWMCQSVVIQTQQHFFFYRIPMFDFIERFANEMFSMTSKMRSFIEVLFLLLLIFCNFIFHRNLLYIIRSIAVIRWFCAIHRVCAFLFHFYFRFIFFVIFDCQHFSVFIRIAAKWQRKYLFIRLNYCLKLVF